VIPAAFLLPKEKNYRRYTTSRPNYNFTKTVTPCLYSGNKFFYLCPDLHATICCFQESWT
jgi:hypothetical protein